MSGNGEYIPGNELGRLNLGGPEGTDLPPLYLPTGYGGGCIKSGPFKDSEYNAEIVSIMKLTDRCSDFESWPSVSASNQRKHSI